MQYGNKLCSAPETLVLLLLVPFHFQVFQVERGAMAMIADSIRRLSMSYAAADKVPDTVADVEASSDAGSIRLGSATTDIDIDHINKSLDHVNNYSKRRMADKLPPVLMYEITSSGDSCYKSITLRELLNEVNDEASLVDEGAFTLLFEGHNQNVHVQSHPNQSTEHEELKYDMDKSKFQRPFDSSGGGVHGAHRRSSTVSGIAASKSLAELRSTGVEKPTALEGERFERPERSEVTYDATGTLRLRDLRRLDFQFNPNEERSVLIRRHAVLFAMVSTGVF
jgi:hypothetical protein